MALIVIDSSDTIAELVDKLNTISTRVGDITKISEDVVENAGDMVTAVNEYRRRITGFDDSAEQIVLARKTYLATQNGGNGQVVYDEDTGVITYTGQSAGETWGHFSIADGGGLTFSNGDVSIQPGALIITYFGANSIDSRVYKDDITTNVLNSAGEVVLTLRSPEN